MSLQENLLKKWQERITAGWRREYTAVCGLWEDESEYVAALIKAEGEPAIIRRLQRERARLDFDLFLSGQGLRPEKIGGAVMLPGMTLLDSYEEQLGRLGEKEVPGAVRWSLLTRETIMERPVWWAAAPVDDGENSSGVYRVEAIPREEGEKGLALLRSLGIEPLAVFVERGDASGAANTMMQRGESEYRIGVPELAEPLAADEGNEVNPAGKAAYLLWADLGRSLPTSCADHEKSLVKAAVMNFLPMEERPELYRWPQIVAVLLFSWLACLGGFFFRGQQETEAAFSALSQEETLLQQQDIDGEERRQMMADEKLVITLEGEAVRLSALRRPVTPTLEALGTIVPVGMRLIEVTGQLDGTVRIKGAARNRKQVEEFIDSYCRWMNPEGIKLASIAEGKSVAGIKGVGREFVIILGEEKQP